MVNDIQRLREMTGAGVMECKRALTDAAGNFEAAVKLIAERGLAKADKKATRETGAGHLESYIHNGRVGVLLLVRCETDFVAHAEPFRELAHNLALHIAAAAPESPEALLAQPYIRDESITVQDFIKGTIAKVGENIRVERFVRYEL